MNLLWNNTFFNSVTPQITVKIVVCMKIVKTSHNFMHLLILKYCRLGFSGLSFSLLIQPKVQKSSGPTIKLNVAKESPAFLYIFLKDNNKTMLWTWLRKTPYQLSLYTCPFFSFSPSFGPFPLPILPVSPHTMETVMPCQVTTLWCTSWSLNTSLFFQFLL